MQPLDGNSRHQDGNDTWHADAALEGDIRTTAGARPWPRFARKSVRFIKGITLAGLFASRAVRVFVLAVAVIAGAGYSLHMANRDGLIAYAGSKLGFEASKLVVNGNRNLDINVLQARLGTQLGSSLFSFNVDKARSDVLNDPWVKSATIRKVYPDTIIVDVVERKPVALWKSNGHINLISRNGFVIGDANPEHMHLPQVVGHGANIAAAEFLSVISKFPVISGKASAYVRVAGRRWNVRFIDGPKVLLPEANWQSALGELQGLQQEKELLDRDIIQLDMRLPDRLVIKLDRDVAELRKAVIQKSLKRDWHRI